MFKKILSTGAIALLAAAGVKAVNKCMFCKMPSIGDRAPFFVANTTKGEINFPCDYHGSWVVFFSYPADFTSVCTTELMMFEKYHEKFKEINTQLLGLSVDDIHSHRSWITSIKENIAFNNMQDVQISFPLADDKNGAVAKKYGMLQNNSASAKTIRAVFIVDPKSTVRAILCYPQTTGRNIEEILRLVKALQVSDMHDVATPVNWHEGDDVIVLPDKKVYQLSEEEQKERRITCHEWYLCTQPLSKDA